MNTGAKNRKEILANQIQQHIKRIIHYDHMGFMQGMQRRLNIHKSVDVTRPS